MPARKMKTLRIGVDTGGTFTDFISFDGSRVRVHKVPSTPDAPERAILQDWMKSWRAAASPWTSHTAPPWRRTLCSPAGARKQPS